jgi:hypothetical protein
MTNFGSEYLGVRTVYHCTNQAAARSTRSQKMMKPGRSGLFGPAIYFTDNEAAARHKCSHHDPSGPQYDEVLVYRVDFGTALVVQGTSWKSMNRYRLSQYGCDSLKGRSHSGADWEYVIYDPSLPIP